jgi:hypothetical protein
VDTDIEVDENPRAAEFPEPVSVIADEDLSLMAPVLVILIVADESRVAVKIKPTLSPPAETLELAVSFQDPYIPVLAPEALHWI